MNHLYCDGGVILKNPSPFGGTWAVRLLNDDNLLLQKSGVMEVSPGGVMITNNTAELYALVKGLTLLHERVKDVCVHSDSQVALGWAFLGYNTSGIPPWLLKALEATRTRLVNWNTFEHERLDGHPTAKELSTGVGKRGGPVSAHNLWCDNACKQEAKLWVRCHPNRVQKES